MRYKFKPQTCLLVAGIAASACATCYYPQTAATTVCFYSGSAVDTIYWQGGATFTTVHATSDWNRNVPNTTQVSNSGKYLVSVVSYNNGNGGYNTYNADTPVYCYGPAQFLDAAGNTDSVPYWEANLVRGSYSFASPASGGTWGEATGSPTCN